MTLFLLLYILAGPLLQDRLIDRAAFLKGCWQRTVGTRMVEEQ